MQKLLILLLFVACKKDISKHPEGKAAKAAIDTAIVVQSNSLSDSIDQEEMPRQEGEPIFVNGRIFINH